MKVKLILPALLEATDPGFRPIKYALFPPLGLAALAGYLGPDDEVVLEDEHVMPLTLDDAPDLVVMSVYVTSARRAYALADHYRGLGSHVALGGLHVSSRPDEAAAHADSVFIGPGEDTWPAFLADLRRGEPAGRYVSQRRSLEGVPPVRRDLIDRRRYLCPNSIVVSRGCPHHCDFCYKDAFYGPGVSFYVETVDRALAEIEAMPGRHVYFLDDHLLGNPRFAAALFAGMRGMGADGRITDTDWDHYDTRHVVFRPRHMTAGELLSGYQRAYREFYAWRSIVRGAAGQATPRQVARHLAYAGGWKRLEPMWDAIIRSRRTSAILPLLEATLDAFGGARGGAAQTRLAGPGHAGATDA